jgi:hypothetical protein
MEDKAELVWLNVPGRALSYCTPQCKEGGRIKAGHDWDDEGELVPCVYCQNQFHSDCLVSPVRFGEGMIEGLNCLTSFIRTMSHRKRRNSSAAPA